MNNKIVVEFIIIFPSSTIYKGNKQNRGLQITDFSGVNRFFFFFYYTNLHESATTSYIFVIFWIS